MQEYVKSLRMTGGVINTLVVMAAASRDVSKVKTGVS